MSKAGRNDPCPCGSGKKYKSCCINLDRPQGTSGGLKRKITAKVLTVPPKAVNLMERTYGDSLHAIEKGETPKSVDPKEPT